MRTLACSGIALLSACGSPASSERASRPQTSPPPIVASEVRDVQPAVDRNRELLSAAQAARAAGDLALARSEIEECVRVLTDAEHRPSIGAHLELLEQAAQLAKELGALPVVQQAMRFIRDERERTLPDDAPEVQNARVSLAAITYRIGDVEGARALEEKVLDVYQRTLPEDHAFVQRARMNLAGTLYSLGDMPAAQALMQKALAIQERTLPADHPDIQRSRIVLGAIYQTIGDLDLARALLEKAVAAFERTVSADDLDLARARQDLAVTLAQQGDDARARPLFEQVLATFERTLPTDHPELSGARGNVATSLRLSGELSEARSLQERVLASLERALPEDHPYVQTARHELALTLSLQGDLARARGLQERVLAVRERTLPPDHPDLLDARQNLALTLLALGDDVSARVLLEGVLAVRERALAEDDPGVMFARANLALAMRAMGDLAGARGLQESSLAVLERMLPEDHPNLCASRADLARTLELEGDYAGACAMQERVLASRERTLTDDHPHLAAARGSLAMSRLALGDVAQARVLAQLALDAYQRTLPVDHIDLIAARCDLVGCLAHSDSLPDLSRELHALAAGLEVAFERARTLPDREARELARSLQIALDTLLSCGAAEPSLRERGFDLVESMRSLGTDPPAGAHEAADAEGVELARRGRQLRAELGDLLSGADSPTSAADVTSRIAELVRARDRIEAELREHRGSRAPVASRVEVATLARALPGDARAVGYRRYTRSSVDPNARGREHSEESFLAHVVRPDGSLARVELGPAAPIEAAVDAWRKAVGVGAERGRGTSVVVEAALSEDGLAQAAVHLRRLVFDPVLAAIGDARTLFVSLDDVLHAVALDALPLDDGSLVGERVGVHTEVSFERLLAPRPPATTDVELVALGGVDYAADVGDDAPSSSDVALSPPLAFGIARGEEGEAAWSDLPGSWVEVTHIADRFRSTFDIEPVLLSQGQATKAALTARSASARFLHIATHGWFAPDRVRSDADPRASRGARPRFGVNDAARGLAPKTLCGLALAGANRGSDALGRVRGILTAEELAGFDLSQCELAVLSACDTNVGVTRAGQGIQSLQAALHAAGARTAITSLWKVDDEKTRELFEDFYTRVWVNKERKSEALWNAKKALRAKGYPTRDWAAWVLTGEPN